MTNRLEELERHGRAYGELRLAIGWTDGLQGDAAKVSRNWQSKPDRLVDARHGAGMLHRGVNRNPVVSLRASGLIGIDIDGEAGRALVRQLIADGFPATVTVQSGRRDGGVHLWFRPPAGARAHKIEFSGEGLKLSSDGYLVVPPAIHSETGAVYKFLDGREPWRIQPTLLPVSILNALEKHHRASDEAKRADDQSPLEPGDRHPHLRRIGGAMRRSGAREESITAALLVENELRCSPPKPERTVRALARDLCERYPAGART